MNACYVCACVCACVGVADVECKVNLAIVQMLKMH